MSGNCADFVTRADQLGALDRSAPKKLPGSEASLKTTIWWGCGPGARGIADRALSSLPPVRLPAPPPLTPSARPPQCEDVPLQSARADHQRAFDCCKNLVIQGLRDDLLAAHSENTRGMQGAHPECAAP